MVIRLPSLRYPAPLLAASGRRCCPRTACPRHPATATRTWRRAIGEGSPDLLSQGAAIDADHDCGVRCSRQYVVACSELDVGPDQRFASKVRQPRRGRQCQHDDTDLTAVEDRPCHGRSRSAPACTRPVDPVVGCRMATEAGSMAATAVRAGPATTAATGRGEPMLMSWVTASIVSVSASSCSQARRTDSVAAALATSWVAASQTASSPTSVPGPCATTSTTVLPTWLTSRPTAWAVS
jgi:hypothetical protein